jgi:hypothetical protein
MSAPPHSRQNQQQVHQSFQTSNVNSSVLNDIFNVVATTSQKIMTELNGAESEEDRIMAVTKIVLKLMNHNGG